MILDNIETIARLCDSGQYEEADQLIPVQKRTLNSTQSFRSALMLSAHNVKHLQKILDNQAECIMLNLEDGVSEQEKPKALRLCALLLSSLLTCKKKLVVRVNALDEGGEDEIRYLAPYMPDAFRIPKVRSKEDVNRVLSLIGDSSELHLSIETKESWLALKELRTDARVSTFYLGILDLLADLQLPQSLIQLQNPTMHYILSRFLLTCKAIGVKPVSFVFQDYRDSVTFKQWLELEKEMGYSAKGCLSPTQVGDTHDVLGMSELEIQRAQEIIKRFEIKREEGITGFDDADYGFIDEPIYKGALAVLKNTANI
ncbi:MAG: aldolase/citrate lyase family protein [Campylobacterota bacterium]|nr:aldolase/citrate lyase family protein [Campylobacterota bacterium]